MPLHFSYGANMDRAGMAKRCPGASALGAAVLDNYRFVITADGYASVTPAAGESVHGVLWKLTPRDLQALNIFESLDSGLYRHIMLPVRIGGRRMQAGVYLGRKHEGKPKPGYLELIVSAAREWNLPPDHIAELQRWRRAAGAASIRRRQATYDGACHQARDRARKSAGRRFPRVRRTRGGAHRR